MISYLLEIISNENLIDIAKNVKLKIKGFRTIQYKNGIISPPKKLIIKELLKPEYKSLVNKYFSKESKCEIKLEIDNIDSLNNMNIEDKNKFVEQLEQILSFNNDNKLKIGGRELDLITIKDIFSDENNEELNSNDYSKQINQLNKDMQVLKKKVTQLEKKRLLLEDNNKKMILDIKNLKKENITLQEENEKIKKENQIKIKENEKYQNDFYSIKKKYDEIKFINASQERSLKEEKSKIEYLEKNNDKLKIKLNSLDNIEKERRKNQIKKIVVFGEIYSKQIKEIDDYDICTVQTNKLEDYRDVINKCNEIWILSYDISYLDKINVEENVDLNKIKEFTSYKKLREYLKREN